MGTSHVGGVCADLGLDSTSRESKRFACSPSVTLGTGTRGRRRRQPSDAETARLKARLPQ